MTGGTGCSAADQQLRRGAGEQPVDLDERTSQRRRIGEVGADGPQVGAAQCLGLRRRLEIEIGDHRTTGREAVGDDPADAARAAGDNDPARSALVLFHVLPP